MKILLHTSRWAVVALVAASACDENKPVPPPAFVGVNNTPPEDPTSVVRLSNLSGGVQIERNGKQFQALEGTLKSGDIVETQPNGRTVLNLADGREVEISGGTRLSVTEKDGKLQFEVLRGSVISRVPQEAVDSGSAVALAVLTPEGITRISGLSEVAITVNGADGKTEVDVRLGSVEFLDKSGTSSDLNEGDKLLVDAGKVEILTRGGTNEGEAQDAIQLVARKDFPSARASVRKAGSRAWSPMKGQEVELSVGDAIRMDRGGSTLALGSTGSKVAAASGSEVTYLGGGTLNGIQKTEFDIKKGSVALALTGLQTERVSVPGLTVSNTQGGNFSMRKTRTGYDVEAVAGDLELTRPDGTVEKLAAGQRAQVSGAAAAQMAPIPRAVFSLPSRRGQRVFHTGIDDVALSWDGEENKDYVVEVSEDESFATKVVAGVVHKPELNVPTPSKGNLHWRVKAKDGGTEVATGSAIFAPDKRTRDLALSRNEVPEDAEKTTIYFQDKPPALTFQFKPEDGASKYQLRVYRADSLTKPVVDRVSNEAKSVLEAGALDEGAYVWSATPLSSAGKPLRSSRMTPLELTYDNAVPTLVVLSPDDGARVAGRSIEAAGIAPMGSRIFVNGQAAPLDDKHRFRVNVAPLSGQPSLVVFKMAQPGGPDVFRVRKLKRGK